MKFDFLIENLLNKKTFVIVSGLHGDEPAGNIAAQFFTNKKNVHVISNINCTNKRRMNGKDLNHFLRSLFLVGLLQDLNIQKRQSEEYFCVRF